MDSVNGTPDGNKPQKRVVTEARREQNRVAQRIYRQRQRDRRSQKRQNLASPVTYRQMKLRPKEPDCAEPGPCNNLATNATPFNVCEFFPTQEEYQENELDCTQHLFNQTLDISNPDILSSSVLSYTSILPGTLASLTDLAPFPDVQASWNPSDFAEIRKGWAPEDAQYTQDEPLGTIEDSEGSETVLNGLNVQDNPKTTTWHQGMGGIDFSTALLNTLPPVSVPEHSSSGDTAVLDDPMTWNVLVPTKTRSSSLEDIIAAGLQALALGDSAFSSHQGPNTIQTSCTAPPGSYPSPYLWSLPNAATNTLSACLRNAHIIGLFPTASAKPCCMTPSPFYHSCSSKDHLPLLLAAASKAELPIDLRPTAHQIIYQHPSFLDLIPMPGFRARVISTALGRGTGRQETVKLNLLELKKDIFHGGLTFNGNEKAGRSQPWDIESWQAAGWFVKKWNMLFDKGYNH